jgi:hypothetical protein
MDGRDGKVALRRLRSASVAAFAEVDNARNAPSPSVWSRVRATLVASTASVGFPAVPRGAIGSLTVDSDETSTLHSAGDRERLRDRRPHGR